jgi:DtxR family Mn-dependent transcriptional regulator
MAHAHRSAAETGTNGAAKITPATENYLQAIYALTAERKSLIGARLAEHLRVSPPSITQTLQRLAKAGYVELIDRGDRKEIVLTEAGRAIGEAATRKHRLIERWLQGELHLTSTEAHEAAHAFEAGFNDTLLDRLFESIGRPTHCPHGNPIPGSGAEMDHSGIYLDNVNPGERVWLARITEEAEADLDLLEYLERNGARPGTPLDIIAVDRKTGAVTARTDAGKEIRLERRSASLIYVRRDESVAAA